MPRKTFCPLIPLLVLALLVIPESLLAQPTGPREILYVPWGDDNPAGIRHVLEPGCRFGPQSFRVESAGDVITVLDPLDRTLKSFRKGSLIRSTPAPDGSRDFLAECANSYVFLAHNRLLLYRDGRQAASYGTANSLPLIRQMENTAGDLVLTRHDGTMARLTSDLGVVRSMPGAESGTRSYQAVKRSAALAELLVTDSMGRQTRVGRVIVPSGNLGCVRVIGSDDLGRIFLDINLVERAAPLAVRREVWVVDRTGLVQGRVEIPTHYYTRMFRDLELHANGDLYHMISAADGLHVFKWAADATSDGSYRGFYPSRFREKVHYNFLATDEAPGGRTQLSVPGTKALASTVTRNQAVGTGDTYVQHQWTATAANLTNGVVTDPDGDLVQTPDWVVVGLNQAIPYKWGGYNTISYFDAGMTGGYYAGDIHTDGFSSYARGVDCSGFVCRCWNTDGVYTTSEMDDPAYGPITLPLATWDDIQAGDAIHKHGHVRMAITGLQDGSILTVESAGTSTDWRVGYSSYTLAELEDYTPRYYIGMEGALPAIISAGSGSWTSGTTWVGGVAPTAADDVLI
ncbi:hypothetical protein DRQ50_12465, partial [bacterium]